MTVMITAIAGVSFVLVGLWAFVDPSGFYDNVAEFPPYNEHFLHDIGAFQMGIGAALLAACWRRDDAIACAALGGGVASAVHTVAHVVDHDLGGTTAQTVTFGVLAALLLAVATARFAAAERTAG